MNTGSEQWRKYLVDGASQMDIQISEDISEAFSVYAEELLKWNRKINLTSITQPEELAVKHFLDSIILSVYIPEGSYLNLLSLNYILFDVITIIRNQIEYRFFSFPVSLKFLTDITMIL